MHKKLEINSNCSAPTYKAGFALRASDILIVFASNALALSSPSPTQLLQSPAVYQLLLVLAYHVCCVCYSFFLSSQMKRREQHPSPPKHFMQSSDKSLHKVISKPCQTEIAYKGLLKYCRKSCCVFMSSTPRNSVWNNNSKEGNL